MGMTREEAREYVESTPEDINDILAMTDPGESYDAAGRFACRLIMRHYESHPQDLPTEVWDLDDDAIGLPDAGFTGFQVGYALRMARYILTGK